MRPDGPERYRRILAAVDVVPGDDDAETHALNRRILDWSSSWALADLAELHLVHAWDAPATGLLRRWNTSGLLQETANEEYRYVEDTRNRHQYALSALLDELSDVLGPEGFGYLAIQSHLPKGSAIDVIPNLAADLKADLIVMGTVGRGGIPGLLIGNTAETILNRCDCAVLAIKPPSFVSPVGISD
ncbi:universal stress protein [uncultured Thiocystis sp.]|uniref:universal stress protein n=1 Tax=uncultured Thiocystis sp. TaxID=1202134 RepID=UPI0025D8CBBA|nr:universal stress protein [uncultured Thiocystis sp.]